MSETERSETPASAATTDSQGMKYLESTPRRLVTVYLPLAVFLFVLLFPFYWMTITAFKPNEELLSREGNPFWVINPTLAHIKKLLFDTAYPDWLWNTILVSVVSTLLSLFCSVLAAYAIERLRTGCGTRSSCRSSRRCCHCFAVCWRPMRSSGCGSEGRAMSA
jgi:ABC-type maltose transport system permease subunit